MCVCHSHFQNRHDAVKLGSRSHNGREYAALLSGKNGKIEVYELSSSSSDDEDSPFVAKAASKDDPVIYSLDPVESALTGGGACRFCVKECPENT